MRVDVITIFPDLVRRALAEGMARIAQERGALELTCHDLRDFADDPHRSVDDAPYGGGPGMVMKPEPFFRAVDAVRALDAREPLVILLTPIGERLVQKRAEDLSGRQRLLILCGRYEGVDERVRSLADLELSVGDFVLSGGELAAAVLIDAVSRLLGGVLSNEQSLADESFRGGLLEYPQYTRPAKYRGMSVPEVLLSGDHARIAAWRRKQAFERTMKYRPDLLDT